MIYVNDSIPGDERRKYIRDYQIIYYANKGLSLQKTAREMGYCRRALSNYINNNPEIRETIKGIEIKAINTWTEKVSREFSALISNKLASLDIEEKSLFLHSLKKYIENN